MLLRELIKVTVPDHVDYEKLQFAYDRIAMVNQTINAQRAEHETFAMIHNLRSKLKDSDEPVDLSGIDALLMDPTTKKPIRKYKGYEGPGRMTTSTTDMSSDSKKIIDIYAYVFKDMLFITYKNKKQPELLILDFSKESPMDVTLMPSTTSSVLPKESIHMLVADDRDGINHIYSLHFSDHMGSTKVHESWKNALEKTILKSQKKKDMFREHKDKKKKVVQEKEENEMIREYRRIFEVDRSVDTQTLFIMDKYCPSEATKRQFGHDKKVKQLTHNKSIGKIGDVKQKEAEENLLRKFLGQKGDRKSVAEDKPKGYVSPYAETTEIKPLEEKPKGYVSPYEEPAKTTETVDKEKPKGYVSPYDEQPSQLLAKSSDKNVKKQDTGHQIGDEVKKLFGGVEKLLHINDHKDSKKKDEKKKEEKKEEKKK